MNELYVELLRTDKVSLKRTTEGRHFSGNYVPGTPKLIDNVVCSVQPTNGEDLQKLPEYAKETQTYRFFSEDFDFKKNDIVSWESQEYEILHLEPWNHYNLMTDHSYGVGVLVDNRRNS